MKLRTEIEPMPLRQPISCRDGIFILGSCFADNIGSWLKELCLNVCCNPIGVLYNPASIAKFLEGVCAEKDSLAVPVQGSDGLYYSFSHHGSFCGETPEQLLSQINEAQETATKAFKEAKHVVVTFGTAWVYEREGEVVANCHKFPAKTFVRRRLSVEEIVEIWKPLIESSGRHFVFTVSPIRHVKDTLHGNQISKSTLLLAIDSLCEQYPDQVEYLPIYELLIDDLRDYRFFADDLVHPSPMAIEMVKEYFAQNCLDKDCQKYIQQATSLLASLNHRPLHPESEAYQSFISETKRKFRALKEEYLK